MALDSNKKPFGFDIEERLRKNTDTPADTQECEYTDTDEHKYTGADTPKKKQTRKKQSTSTPTPTPKYTPAHVPTLGKGERKTERLQLLVRPSTKSRLAEYARDHDTSSNEVVQRLLDDLLAGY